MAARSKVCTRPTCQHHIRLLISSSPGSTSRNEVCLLSSQRSYLHRPCRWADGSLMGSSMSPAIHLFHLALTAPLQQKGLKCEQVHPPPDKGLRHRISLEKQLAACGACHPNRSTCPARLDPIRTPQCARKTKVEQAAMFDPEISTSSTWTLTSYIWTSSSILGCRDGRQIASARC
jgi:hypothetical protein